MEGWIGNESSAVWSARWVAWRFGAGLAIGAVLGALRFLGDPVAYTLSSVGGAAFGFVLLVLLYWTVHPSAVRVGESEIRVRGPIRSRVLPRSEFGELLIAVPPKEASKAPDTRVYDLTIIRPDGRHFNVGFVSAQITRRLMAASPRNEGIMLARGGASPDQI